MLTCPVIQPEAAEAEAELHALGALDEHGVTAAGRALSGLPLDAALGQIERAFGKGSIMKLGSGSTVETEAISTGSLASRSS